MGKKPKKYVVESDFDDLHGDPAEAPDLLEMDLTDSDNPIIQAFANGDDEDWTPPEDDDGDEDGDEDEDEDGEDDTDDEDSEDEDELDDDEDAEEDDDDEDEDEDEDDEKYSKNVQKRIDRERALRAREKEESDRRIAKLERQAKLRDAKDEFATAKQEADSKLRKLRKQKAAALDEGETTKVVDIDEDILDIKADLKARELTLKQTEESIDDDDEPAQGNMPELAREFLSKYPQFHTNPQFKQVLLLTDKAVAARGMDRNTQEYYDEIEQILKPQFPKIIKIAKVTKKRKKKPLRKKRSAVGSTTKPGTRRTSKTSRRRGRIRLTKNDQEQMAVFGLDPTNPADAKAWAEGKGN